MKKIGVRWMVSILTLLLLVPIGCGEKPEQPQPGQQMEQYDLARELARQGDFARAEDILRDLILNQPDSEQAKLASEYLRFEYPMLKATQLMQLGQSGEAEAVLRPLLEQNLSAQERQAVQRQLDSLRIVGMANRQAQIQRTASLCRELQIELLLYYQENGSYPPELSLDNLFSGNTAIKDGFSSIENYQSAGQSFSFDATSREGAIRFHVTDAAIEEIK